MQSGDTVQIQQQDKGVHWIYATVVTANADGSAYVQISHPGNIEHGAFKFVPKAKVRTKADVEALITPDLPKLEKDSLRNQSDWLS